MIGCRVKPTKIWELVGKYLAYIWYFQPLSVQSKVASVFLIYDQITESPQVHS